MYLGIRFIDNDCYFAGSQFACDAVCHVRTFGIAGMRDQEGAALVLGFPFLQCFAGDLFTFLPSGSLPGRPFHQAFIGESLLDETVLKVVQGFRFDDPEGIFLDELLKGADQCL